MGSLRLSVEEVCQAGGSNPSIKTREDLFRTIGRVSEDPVNLEIVRTLLGTKSPFSIRKCSGVGIEFPGVMIEASENIRLQLAGFLQSIGADPGAEKCTEAVLDLDDPTMQLPRIVVQGGHRTSKPEYDFLRQIFARFAEMADGAVVITGGGDCAMEAPFVGIEDGLKAGSLDRVVRYSRVGLAERGILPKERPNKHVERLVVYPNIKERIEAFIRLPTFVTIVPGAGGTVEEITKLKSVLLHPSNQGHGLNAHLIERVGGKWMGSLRDLFDICFPGLLERENCPIKIYPNVLPEAYAKTMMSMPKQTGHPWNDKLVFPCDANRGLDTNDPQAFLNAFEGLELSRLEHEEYSMADTLSSFFSAIVDLTVKYPEIVKEWKSQGQKVRLSGQPEVINALMKFLDLLYAEKRLMKGCATREEIFAD